MKVRDLEDFKSLMPPGAAVKIDIETVGNLLQKIGDIEIPMENKDEHLISTC